MDDVDILLEDIVKECGGFGKFQLLITVIIFVSKISVTWSMLMMAFGGATPDWWCNWQNSSNHEGHSKYSTEPPVMSFKKCHPPANISPSNNCLGKIFSSDMNTVVSEVNLLASISNIFIFPQYQFRDWLRQHVCKNTITIIFISCKITCYLHVKQDSQRRDPERSTAERSRAISLALLNFKIQCLIQNSPIFNRRIAFDECTKSCYLSSVWPLWNWPLFFSSFLYKWICVKDHFASVTVH